MASDEMHPMLACPERKRKNMASDEIHPREKEKERGERRNPSHAENNLEDNPEDLASGARIDLKSIDSSE